MLKLFLKSYIKGFVIAIVLFFIMIALSGCRGDAEEVTESGNFNIELLFENDGCKVYRFRDGSRYIYYSDCRGKVSNDFTTHSGKATITHHNETLNN